MTQPANPETVLVTGAAGFIGSHLVDRLLQLGHQVVGVDNLSRGTRRNLERAAQSSAFKFFEADVSDLDSLRHAFSGYDVKTVWHMAANSDIEAGVADSSIDLRDTFMTTFNTLAVMRERGICNFVFASSSAVYGMHDGVLTEESGPLFPISNYGAMKLASEGMITAAVESFLEHAWIFRFSNVVGSRPTHGIIYDLLNKLSRNPPDLKVLGDGSQQKPYLHISELIDAMLFVHERARDPLNHFLVGPADEGVSVKEIAQAVLRKTSSSIPIRFSGGSGGWVGDVPRFRYSTDKLRRLGWQATLSSREAIEKAVAEISAKPQVQA
ncbi:MAG: SDR family NAD(P)-dependent oxidoreductase [Acidobacteriota bacterium]|nr:SDR family NAD(P)-dependent oxidoreductase [Acidobacteriota bacterium]